MNIHQLEKAVKKLHEKLKQDGDDTAPIHLVEILHAKPNSIEVEYKPLGKLTTTIRIRLTDKEMSDYIPDNFL